MYAYIKALEYYLPEGELTNEQFVAEYPDWTIDKIEAKTGIRTRRIAAEGECSSDLAFAAAQKIFASGACAAKDIDYLLLCTQTPDYFLPTTACLVQDRLGIPKSAGAIDFNLGCSGYIYGLGLAKGLIETGQVKKVLLLTAETYSKVINKGDKSV
jgi:3-oxoacyl-[acyl-carrier-protein] synthase III